MDGRTFDALTRGLSNHGSRRLAVQGLVGGMLGLGLGRGAVAQDDTGVGAEGCKVRRCKRAVLGQSCLDSRGRPDNHQCCQGLKCDNKRGRCRFKNAHGEAGDYCDNDGDCDFGFFCKKNQCIPNSCAGRKN